MRIELLCSDRSHPIYPRLEAWAASAGQDHEVRLVTSLAEVGSGDILFLVSCTEMVPRAVRDRFRATIVLHASDLPEGRGWSPLVWQVVEGRSRFCVTAIGAEDAVDSGPIWAQQSFELQGHELVDEINAALFDAELALVDHVVANFDALRPRAQSTNGVTYYPRRRPQDSRLDPQRSIADQFDLLRVADPVRYPAFFELRGHRYRVVLKKMD